MSSMFGKNLKISLFGESHSDFIGMTIDGLPAGLRIDFDLIKSELDKRKSLNEISTSRREDDEVKFISGYFKEITTGGPLTFLIPNKDVKSDDYVEGNVRPSHADYTYFEKYNGFNDYRGGGSSSGRITACLVVLGAICKQILDKKDIKVGTHISQLYDIKDSKFQSFNAEIDALNQKAFPVIDKTVETKMINKIKEAKENCDSVGGILETAILNCSLGLGEPFFDSFESVLSHLLFSIGGVKGIEFGDGFEFASKLGTEAIDQLQIDDNKVNFLSNHNGGINGGITNGDVILFRTVVKPTPSLNREIESINIKDKKNITLPGKGRFDPCIVHRVRAVVDALTRYCLVEFLMEKESKNI